MLIGGRRIWLIGVRGVCADRSEGYADRSKGYMLIGARRLFFNSTSCWGMCSMLRQNSSPKSKFQS